MNGRGLRETDRVGPVEAERDGGSQHESSGRRERCQEEQVATTMHWKQIFHPNGRVGAEITRPFHIHISIV